VLKIGWEEEQSGGEIMNPKELEKLEFLEFDELNIILQQMSQQELDELQACVIKRMKEIQEDILFNSNFS